MLIDIPRNTPWVQKNKGDIAGTIYSSRNIDLTRKEGFLSPSYKLINTTLDTDTLVDEGSSVQPPITLTTSATENGGFFGIYIPPSGNAYPTRQGNWVQEASTSGTTATKSITVPAGSNQALIVMATCYGPTGVSTSGVSGITFGGVALTKRVEINFGTGDDTDTCHSIWYLAAPSQTTADVVVTWSSASQNKTLQAFVYDGVNQATPLPVYYGYDNSSNGGANTYTIDSIFNSSANWSPLLTFGVTSNGTHTQTGTGGTSLFNATSGVMTYSTYEWVPPDVYSNPQSLITAFCKESGTISGLNATRWWALSNTSIYQSITAKGDFDVDDSSSLPTFTTGNSEGDLKAFNGRVYLAIDNKLYRRTNAAWTTVTSSLDSGKKILEVYGDRLYIASDTTVVSMNTAEVVSSTTYTLDIEQATNENLSISCMRKTPNGLWLGTHNNQGGRAKMIFWDGITQDTIETQPEVESGMVMAMSIKNNVPYIMDNRGILSAYNGSYFEEVGRIDLDHKQLYNFDIASGSNRWIHFNGMQTIDGEILMTINTRMSDITDSQIPRTPSGIYAYNENYGVYHKHAFTAQQDNAIALDVAQLEAVEAGALYSLLDDEQNNESDEQSDFLVSYAYKEDNSTTRYAIAKSDKRGLDLDSASRKTAAVITFTKWFAEEVEENWEKFYVFFKPLINDTENIVLKCRTEEYDPFESDITWIDETTFSSTDSSWAEVMTNFNNGIEYEFEVLQGDGGGYISTFEEITEFSGTYYVSTSEYIDGLTTKTARVRVDRWDTVRNFLDDEGIVKYAAFNPEKVSTWIQYKLYLLGEGIEIQRILAKSSVHTET